MPGTSRYHVEARASFQKLHRKVDRLLKAHRLGLDRVGNRLVEIFRQQSLSGGTTPTRLARRTSDLYNLTNYAGIKTSSGSYFYAKIRFPVRYAPFHISRQPEHRFNLPYGTRVHTDRIIEQHFDHLQAIMYREFRKVGRY